MSKRKPTPVKVLHGQIHDLIEGIANDEVRITDTPRRLQELGFEVWPGRVNAEYVSPTKQHKIFVVRKKDEDWRRVLARLAGKLCEAIALEVLWREKKDEP